MSQTMLAIANLGPTELIIIVAVIFLLFGATRLPQLAKALAKVRKRSGKVSRRLKENHNRARKLRSKTLRERLRD